MPITSPVDFISGPKSISTPENLEKGSTDSLTEIWLTFFSLFVAGIILVGDLVMVLYKFLDGQDLTAAFLLKALVVILVTGGVFGFYLQDIRDRVSPGKRKMWAIGAGVIIIISIILGFGILGSPQNQRLIRQDNQKITDLQNLQWQVISYWQMNGEIPESWPNMIADSQTDKPYEYKKTGAMTFELCAEFNRESATDQNYAIRLEYPKGGMMQNDNWSHSVGRHCFEKVIDPIAYPTQVRG